MITVDSLISDIKRGALALNQIPCTICRKKIVLPRTHFHGSDWGRCTRSVYFECLTGRVPVKNGDDALRLNDGHFHEALLVKMITLSGHTITHRDTIDGEVTVLDQVQTPQGIIKVLTIGHTDGVIDSEAVVECKAVKDWAWKNKFCRRIIPPEYYGQCQFYLHAHVLPHAFLVVKSRHNSDVRIFKIDANEKYVAQRRVLLASIRVALESYRVIAIPKKDPDDECRFCTSYNHCWRI